MLTHTIIPVDFIPVLEWLLFTFFFFSVSLFVWAEYSFAVLLLAAYVLFTTAAAAHSYSVDGWHRSGTLWLFILEIFIYAHFAVFAVIFFSLSFLRSAVLRSWVCASSFIYVHVFSDNACENSINCVRCMCQGFKDTLFTLVYVICYQYEDLKFCFRFYDFSTVKIELWKHPKN